MKAGMTKRQSQCLKFIKEYIKKHGYSPTYKEIMVAVGSNSTGAISEWVKGLRLRGHVNWIPAQSRSMYVIDNEPLPKEIIQAVEVLKEAKTLEQLQSGRDALMKVMEKYHG